MGVLTLPPKGLLTGTVVSRVTSTGHFANNLLTMKQKDILGFGFFLWHCRVSDRTQSPSSERTGEVTVFYGQSVL